MAIIREQQMLPNPKSSTRFRVGDLIGVMGDTTQISAFDQVTHPEARA
jgi:CPA2 family monovalent cation:H+ antiporter-2